VVSPDALRFADQMASLRCSESCVATSARTWSAVGVVICPSPLVAPVPSSVEMAVLGSNFECTEPKNVSSVRKSRLRLKSVARVGL